MGMILPQRRPLWLACSPRQGGNCDAVMELVHKTLCGPESSGPQTVFLRDYTISPCVSCGRCSGQRLACPLFDTDDSKPLLDALYQASALILAAPVYFYHVPAQLKALIDRSQPWWMVRDIWNEAPPVRKTAHIILMGARPQGERLFEGALLSLRYWLDLFGYDLADPLTLYGLDGPDAFRKNAARQERVASYAAAIKAAISRGE